MTQLAQSVLKTIVFFDSQDIPLTLLELREFLIAEHSMFDVSLSLLDVALRDELAESIGHREGFYFLLGRDELVAKRKKRYTLSIMRLRKAKRYLGLLRFVPYVRGVAISGSLAFLNARESSDIDLFIIIRPKRIWITRILISLLFQMLGVRRYQTLVANRFCLNHYVAEDLVVTSDKNLFTAMSYRAIVPVLGVSVIERFLKQNKWIWEYMYYEHFERQNTYFDFHFSRIQKVIEKILDIGIAPFLDMLFGAYQRRRINSHADVIVNDRELSFHFSTRARQVLERYHLTLRQIGL